MGITNQHQLPITWMSLVGIPSAKQIPLIPPLRQMRPFCWCLQLHRVGVHLVTNN
jgi:hypothetical protein